MSGIYFSIPIQFYEGYTIRTFFIADIQRLHNASRQDQCRCTTTTYCRFSQGRNIETTIKSSDTLIIDKKAAVFYQPDSMQIEKRKKEIGEENFMIGADDYLFSLHTAYEFVDSIRLPVLEANNRRFLKFIRSDKSQTLIKLDTVPDLWGVYLFDPSKNPRLIDGIRIEEEYKSYFLE